MSAKPRQVKDPAKDFSVAAASAVSISTPEIARLVERVRADPAALKEYPPAVQLAYERLAILYRQMRATREGVLFRAGQETPRIKARGRPRSSVPAKMLADYEFDVAHNDALRKRGWGNVPPDKSALNAIAKRRHPNGYTASRTANG